MTLRLPLDLSDKASAHAISELVSLAVKDPLHATVSLKDIYDAVSRDDGATCLDPLEVLPTLLPCRDDGALDLIRLCASNNSPKEVMIVIQEAIERLHTCLGDSEDEDDPDPGLVQSVIGIVSLYSPAISRSPLGKRSAFALCSPVLESVASLISSVAPFATKEQGRALIVEVAALVESLSSWSSEVAGNELQDIKRLLREVLDTTVISCASSIQASLAVRAAENYFPRSFLKSSAKDGWQGGETAMLQVQLALQYLGEDFQTTNWKASSLSDLIYLAHSTPPTSLSTFSPSDLHRLLISALQMNVAVDESLFLLFRMLTHEDLNIPLDVATPLCTVLTALASTHLDPTIRQLNLRLLSVTLTKVPPGTRLQILLELTTDDDFPQMRGPAVGLVKEAVLEALALPSDQISRNPFASPELLRVFGHVLFRPNPPDFFGEQKTNEELLQSLELLRIADCLSFYYVLLQRDRDNKTGIRSEDNVTNVYNTLLGPLRRFLDEYFAREDSKFDAEQPLMAMSSLQIGLDRIDSALRSFGMEGTTRTVVT